jgi:hypothetical protein
MDAFLEIDDGTDKVAGCRGIIANPDYIGEEFGTLGNLPALVTLVNGNDKLLGTFDQGEKVGSGCFHK